MMKNRNRKNNIGVFGSRIFDGCKTILQLSLRLGLIGAMLVSAACNPSTTNYHNQTLQPTGGGGGEDTQRDAQVGGPGSGGGGTGDGGGGQGVYCSETATDKNIKGKLFVRDVYEAIKNHKRTMPIGKLGAGGTDTVDESSIKHLVDILKKYYGPASGNLDFVNVEYWKKFADNISFIPDDANLHPSQDANSPLALPEGCKVVQIAYWDESSGPVEDGTLYVDKKTWMQLDQFNKIALLVHEFYFKQARKAGYKNSDFVRYKVGQLLSQEGLRDIFHQWAPSKDSRVKDVLPEKTTGFKYCKGTSENDPNAKLQMYQYEGKDEDKDGDKLQYIVFPVIKSSSVNFSDFQIAEVKFSKKEHENISFITDLLLPLSHFKRIIGTLNDEGFQLQFGNLPFMSARYGRETFVDDSIENSSPEKFKLKIIDMVSDAKLEQEISWTVKSRSGSAKIQMHSPAYKRDEVQERAKSLTTDELIREVNKHIMLVIMGDLKVSLESYKHDILIPALSVLNKELEEGKAAGTYPQKLPKWTAELRKIEKQFSNILTREEKKPVKFAISNDSDLLGTLPRILYALKINAYDADEVMRAIHGPWFDKTPEIPISLRAGSLTITEGSNSVTFTLDCQDSIDIFKEKTNKREYSKQVEQVKNTSLRVVPENQSEQEPGFANYLRHRDEFIKMISGNVGILKRGSSEKCKWSDNNIPLFCADLNSLMIDLREESDVIMEECFGYAQPSARKLDKLQTCRILNLKKAQQRYLVIFDYPYDRDYLQGRSSDPGEFSWVQVLRIP